MGGHCIPIDPWFLVQDIEPGELIRRSRAINDQRPKDVAARVQRELEKTPGAKVAVLGTAYKADIDDDRESPAHAVIEALRAAGFEVLAHDPHVRSPAVSQDLGGVLEGARCVVLVTDHQAYEDITFELERGVAVITLDRPEQLNTFSGKMGEELGHAYRRADEDDAVRVVVLTGAGKAFCAGADMSAGEDTFASPDPTSFSAAAVDPPEERLDGPAGPIP